MAMPVTTFKGIIGYGHPRSYEGTPDVLYQNNGDGTFTNIAEIAGVTNPAEGRGMAAVACDYDNDGFPDIYVTNDTNRNFLYHNNGDGTFTDESLFIGIGYDENGVAEGVYGGGTVATITVMDGLTSSSQIPRKRPSIRMRKDGSFLTQR